MNMLADSRCLLRVRISLPELKKPQVYVLWLFNRKIFDTPLPLVLHLENRFWISQKVFLKKWPSFL